MIQQPVEWQHKIVISIIVAIDQKRGIGKNNDLLFKIPEDFKRMKQLTSGHPLVMGRNTYESIGRPLPNRTNIVITRDPSVLLRVSKEKGWEGIIVVHSLDEGIAVAKKSPGEDEIFIFGGGKVFEESMQKNLIDRLYVTLVKGDYGADVFFPDYSSFQKIIEKEEHADSGYDYTFLTLEK